MGMMIDMEKRRSSFSLSFLLLPINISDMQIISSLSLSLSHSVCLRVYIDGETWNRKYEGEKRDDEDNPFLSRRSGKSLLHVISIRITLL